MRVIMDRNVCLHHPTACEGCLGEYLQFGMSCNRPCIVAESEDGKPEFTVQIRAGRFVTELVITDENRDRIIFDGWMKYVQLPPEAASVPCLVTPAEPDSDRK